MLRRANSTSNFAEAEMIKPIVRMMQSIAAFSTSKDVVCALALGVHDCVSLHAPPVLRDSVPKSPS